MNIVTFLETLVNNILDAEDKFFLTPPTSTVWNHRSPHLRMNW